MSKTVIVFSTRFIGPFQNNCLFSENRYERKTFSSDLLADYFWNMIKQDNVFIKEKLNDSYLDKKALETISANKSEEGLEEYLGSKKNQEELKYALRQLGINKPFSITYFDWIDEIVQKGISGTIPNPIKDKLKKLLQYYVEYKKHNKPAEDIIERIKHQTGIWIGENLKSDNSDDQVVFNLDNKNARISRPWLAYRFSYYQLNENNDEISVYAVWPLKKRCPQGPNGSYAWVDALTHQFLDSLNKDAKEIYLILHDVDIEKSIFKILIDDTVHQKTNRYVALFQHIDAMGNFLKKPCNNVPEGIRSFVKQEVNKARIRKWLCEAYQFITADTDEQLLKNFTKNMTDLDKIYFKNIIAKAESIISNTGDNQYQPKFELINLLNDELKKRLIVNNPDNDIL